MESVCWSLFVMSMQFVIAYVITVHSCRLSCIFTFHSKIMRTIGSNRQKCWENWELHFKPWTFIQMSVHLLILETRKKFLQFFLHRFSYKSVSEVKQKYLCCKSWLRYLKNRACEVIQTLLNLIFWLLGGGNYLFLLSEISVDVFSLNSKLSNVSCSKCTAVNSC